MVGRSSHSYEFLGSHPGRGERQGQSRVTCCLWSCCTEWLARYVRTGVGRAFTRECWISCGTNNVNLEELVWGPVSRGTPPR